MTIHDPTGRGTKTATLRIRGLVVAVVLATVGAVLYQLGAGTYERTFTLTVLADTIGEGLARGTEVKFHGLPIGTVAALESAGYDKQKMTVELGPRQAKALTADTKAQFTSSNIFGTAAVELVSGGEGAPLKPNQTLMIGSGAPAASVAGILRQGQTLGRILDSPDVDHIVEVLRRHADLTEPVTRSGFDFAKILVDAQTVPFSQTLSVAAGVIDGLNEFIPLIGLANDLLDGLRFLAEPGGPQRVNLIVGEISTLLVDVNAVLARNLPWFLDLINSIFNLAIPSSYLLGSLAPAYDRLSGLLDRTSAAFPVIDGKVRAQVEVILDTAPGLAAALPPTPGPSPAPAGGGR